MRSDLPTGGFHDLIRAVGEYGIVEVQEDQDGRIGVFDEGGLLLFTLALPARDDRAEIARRAAEHAIRNWDGGADTPTDPGWLESQIPMFVDEAVAHALRAEGEVKS